MFISRIDHRTALLRLLVVAAAFAAVAFLLGALLQEMEYLTNG